MRIETQRAPSADDIPGPALVIATDGVAELLAAGAIAIDVLGAANPRYDELDGTWQVNETRMSLPGAVWLPETGRGTLGDEMLGYLKDNLAQLTGNDLTKPIIVFCVADCWMSWNAAQRIAGLGYEHVHWFRRGTDDWTKSGRKLEPVDPITVQVD
jgi:PQQ-dependent catabolism-associated CXXCW motif protein